jgi:hypothetical protein
LKIIIKNEEPIRLYHHPRDVSILPKSKLVRTFNADGSLLEEFKFLDKEIVFDEDLDKDQTEIIVTLHVERK